MSGSSFPPFPWSSGQELGAQQLDDAFNNLYGLYNNLSNAIGLIQTGTGSGGPVGITLNWSGTTIVTPGTYIIELFSPFQFTISSVNYGIGQSGGSFTYTVRNAGVGIQGLNNISVSNQVIGTALATAGNVILQGNQLDVVISNVTGSPNGAVLQINGTRSASAPTAIPVASATTLGGVIIGAGLNVTGSGVISTTNAGYVLPTASPTVLGGIQVGSGLAITGNILSVPSAGVVATTTSQGIMQVGGGLGVSSGIVNVLYGTTANTSVQGNDSRISGAIGANSPAFTGTPTAPTPANSDNSTTLATTAFVKNQNYLTSIPIATSTLLGGVKPDGTTLINSLGSISVNYGTTANTSVQGNDSRIAAAAPLANPAFTGTPTAPTPAPGDNDTSIATTAFVTNAISSSGVSSVAGFTGVVTAANLQSAGFATLVGPVFTGNPQAPTATPGDSDNSLATTAFVTNAVAASTSGVSQVLGNTGAVTLAQLVSGGVAPLASPTFTGVVTIPGGASIAGYALNISPAFSGTPTAPTATAGTNTTQIATTQFVTGAVAASTTGVSSVLGNTGAVTLANLVAGGVVQSSGGNTISGGQTFSGPLTFGSTTVHTGTSTFNGIATFTTVPVLPAGIVNYAPFASPTFTGIPAAPTATTGTNTTQLATTAFVTAAVAASTTGVSSVLGNTGAITLGELVSGGLAQTGGTNTFSAAQTFGTTTLHTGIATFTAVPVLPAGIVNYAPIASPTFTGTPTVPGYLTTATATSTYAPLASPTFTGNVNLTGAAVTAATATLGNSSTLVATTAFVQAAFANSIAGTLITATGTPGVMRLDATAGATIDSSYPFPTMMLNAPVAGSTMYWTAPRAVTITGVNLGAPGLTSGASNYTYEVFANNVAVPGLTSIVVTGTTGILLYTPTNPIAVAANEQVFVKINTVTGTIPAGTCAYGQYAGTYA